MRNWRKESRTHLFFNIPNSLANNRHLVGIGIHPAQPFTIDFAGRIGFQSVEDLFLVTILGNGKRLADMLCPACRKGKQTDLGIPIQLLDRTTLKKLFARPEISGTSPGVRNYLALLDSCFQ